MAQAFSARTSLTILAVAALLWSAYVGEAFLTPLSLALFLVALVWPVQIVLQARIGRASAVIITFSILLAAIVGLSTTALWALENIWRTISGNAERYQSLYHSMALWLENHGVVLPGLWAETFDINWMLRLAQQFLSRTGQTMSFWAIVIAYVVTALFEVPHFARSIDRYCSPRAAGLIRGGTVETARKLRLYMAVRAVVSLATGCMITFIAVIVGLPLAFEWGVVGFVLNFIPFIGPLIATLLPAAFAFVHLGDPSFAVLLFIGLTILQFIGGNYLEPKISGNALRLSPFIVLVAVFLWTFIWGTYGTFIGVPIAIAIACFAEQTSGSRWLLGLMGAAAEPADDGAPDARPGDQPDPRA